MSNQSGAWAIFHLIKALSGVARADSQQKARQQREQRRRAPAPLPPKQRTGPREWPDPPSWAEGPTRSPTRRPPISDLQTIRDFHSTPAVPAARAPGPRAMPVARPPALPAPEPEPEPQDEAPVVAEVPARSFAKAARLVVTTGRVDTAAIQAATGTDDTTTNTIVLALEGTGIIGPPPTRTVLVQPGGLRTVLARYGMVEDDAPRQRPGHTRD